MDRKVFNDMDISSQIEYINNKLKEYDSFNKLCKGEDLPKSTISERFKNNGYKFIDGQYRLINSPVEVEKIKTEVNIPKQNKPLISPVIDDILNMIQTLQNEVDTLKSEVNKLKPPTKNNIKDIELMSFTGVWQNRNFRVDSNVLKEFNSLCNKKKYSKYKKQDLLSQALKEFIDKYN